MLNDKSVLITGGTGSLGHGLVRVILAKFPGIKRLVIYSRDEMKQYDMAQRYSPTEHDCLRYFIGDVRDESRLRRAMEGVDIVIHAAAMKQIPAAEYNPMECIKTNILGAENVINAALDSKVGHVVALSTDKAAAPINLYGATKLCADKLFVAANNISGRREINFSVVRYGNVMGSRGSVVPFFLAKRKDGVLPITDPAMTRFNILIEEGVDLILAAIKNSWGGEIFIPKIPSFRVTDLATAVDPNARQEIIGIRPGEKLHEEMVTLADAPNTVEVEDYFAILPAAPRWSKSDFIKEFKAREVSHEFSFNSATNKRWLGVDDLRRLIKENVDANFEVDQEMAVSNGADTIRI